MNPCQLSKLSDHNTREGSKRQRLIEFSGNVGLSLGYPTVNTSLSGEFTIFSKLVICFLMIRGRHRGLPYKLDRAIALPGEDPEDFQSYKDEDMA